jgi:hypothetical protein
MTMRAEIFGIVAALIVMAAAPASAAAPLKCGTGQTLVSIDTRECPSQPPLPPVIVQRVCCKNPAGNVQCHPLPVCPTVSPS